ncbi:MAG: GrpB family protein [Capsulimonas sp.]|uniref:GrpB family protein n=1 Tax=Capsulimonas sp. TaxID=2494211 RepID=UPI00326459F6
MNTTSEKYAFKPYDLRYPQLFQQEKARLLACLGLDCSIEHIGSTAVPGLGGKGVIDMFVIAHSTELAPYSDRLCEAGYELRPRAGGVGRLFHKATFPDSDGIERIYHAHLIGLSCDDYEKDIAFRDWLVACGEDRCWYEAVKRQAAETAQGDGERYKRQKTAAMETILTSALSSRDV